MTATGRQATNVPPALGLTSVDDTDTHVIRKGSISDVLTEGQSTPRESSVKRDGALASGEDQGAVAQDVGADGGRRQLSGIREQSGRPMEWDGNKRNSISRNRARDEESILRSLLNYQQSYWSMNPKVSTGNTEETSVASSSYMTDRKNSIISRLLSDFHVVEQSGIDDQLNQDGKNIFLKRDNDCSQKRLVFGLNGATVLCMKFDQTEPVSAPPVKQSREDWSPNSNQAIPKTITRDYLRYLLFGNPGSKEAAEAKKATQTGATRTESEAEAERSAVDKALRHSFRRVSHEPYEGKPSYWVDSLRKSLLSLN